MNRKTASDKATSDKATSGKAEQAEAPTSRVPARRVPARRVPVLLYVDVWDEDGQRHPRGTTIHLGLDLAKKLIAEKKVGRADPLPGDPLVGPH